MNVYELFSVVIYSRFTFWQAVRLFALAGVLAMAGLVFAYHKKKTIQTCVQIITKVLFCPNKCLEHWTCHFVQQIIQLAMKKMMTGSIELWPALSLSEMLTISLPGRFISSTLPVPFLGSGVVVIKALIWHLWWTNVDVSGIWLRRFCSKGWIINWIWRTPMSLLIAAVNREISLRLPRHHWLRPLTKSKID